MAVNNGVGRTHTIIPLLGMATPVSACFSAPSRLSPDDYSVVAFAKVSQNGSRHRSENGTPDR